MNGRWKTAVWIVAGIACAGAAYASYRLTQMREIRFITGAVLRQDPDPGKQPPIQYVQVSLAGNLSKGQAFSGASGMFRLELQKNVHRGDAVTLELRAPGYQPMDVPEFVGDRLYVIRMVPNRRPASDAPAELVPIGDVRIRYAVKSQNTTNVGSAVKLFEVKNQGDVPCDGHELCSPDGKWKAAVGGASLDAEAGNVFEQARVSCIAGPCPFTRIDKDSYSEGGRQISVLVRDWSDTVTFVLEAEVMRSSVNDLVLQTFPVILSQTMSFTLPASAQGPSIEAAVNGEDIIYPLGPNLGLSWADCSLQVVPGVSKLYRCVLKPGYRFK